MILVLLLLIPQDNASTIRKEIEVANSPDRPQLHGRAMARLSAREPATVVPEILLQLAQTIYCSSLTKPTAKLLVQLPCHAKRLARGLIVALPTFQAPYGDEGRSLA